VQIAIISERDLRERIAEKMDDRSTLEE
jgi:hypothetical protein